MTAPTTVPVRACHAATDPSSTEDTRRPANGTSASTPVRRVRLFERQCAGDPSPDFMELSGNADGLLLRICNSYEGKDVCRKLYPGEVEVLIRELGFMLAGGEPQEPPSEPEP